MTRVSRPLCRLRTWLLCAIACVPAVNAIALDLPAEHHAWGRFKPGSWVQTRLTEYSVGEDREEKILHVRSTTTRLETVEDGGVTLAVKTQVDDGAAQESTRRIGWDDLPIDAERDVRLSLSEVKIEGRTYVCQTHAIVTRLEGVESETKWFYCPDRSPYVLKWIRRTQGPAAEFASFEVTGLSLPRQVLARELACVQATLIENTAERGTRQTLILSEAVPGGLVEASGETRDKQQGLLTRRRLELVEFHVEE